jgi:DNA-binding NtrC family response regulator
MERHHDRESPCFVQLMCFVILSPDRSPSALQAHGRRRDDRMTKILVIDDDPRIRQLVSHVLGCVGHVVIAAKDGREGVRLFREERPRLVITEICMPNGRGLDTIHEIRSEAASVLIMAMSGAGPTRMVLDAARKVGAGGAIEKPFSDAQLVEAVYNLLSPASP